MYELRTVKAHKAAGGDVLKFMEDSPGLNIVVDTDDDRIVAWSPNYDHAEEMCRNLNRP